MAIMLPVISIAADDLGNREYLTVGVGGREVAIEKIMKTLF